MTPADLRSIIALLAPYVVIIAVMIFARSGLDATIASLIAGGCLAAIDPRRGQSQAQTTTTTTADDPATTVTETKP